MKKMDRIEIINPFLGICHMQVCAEQDATNEEILQVTNRENPSGTSNGWVEVAREDYKDENLRPVMCGDYENRKHFILIC